MTNVVAKPYPFGAAHTHISSYKGVAPWHYLTCVILKSNIRLGSSLTVQWLFKLLCLHLYHPYTDWYL